MTDSYMGQILLSKQGTGAQAALSHAVQPSKSEKGCFIHCGNETVNSFLW